MRVLLLHPPGIEQCGFTPPPLGLLYVASSLRQAGHEVRVVDGTVEGSEALQRALEAPYGLIGSGAPTMGRHQALAVLQQAKAAQPQALTVMGGVHASLMPKQILTHYPFVDYVVRGPGEQAMVEIANGQHPRGIVKGVHLPVEATPHPAWDLIDLHRYPPRGWGVKNGVNIGATVRVPVIMSRGCLGRCTFCSAWHLWGTYRCRPWQDMIAEVGWLYEQRQARHFCFNDDMMTGDREQVAGFCKAILDRGYKLAWMATTRTDKVDEALLSLMAASGCHELAYGVETGSERQLRLLSKQNTLDATRNAIRWTRQAGIKSVALVMYGLPGETVEDQRATNEFLMEIHPDECGSVGHVMVFPGTALYAACKQTGKITDDFWLGPEPYWTYR